MLALSERLRRSIEQDAARKLPMPLFVTLGADHIYDGPVSGSPTIAMPVFEDTGPLAPDVLGNFAAVIVASDWNAAILAELGYRQACVAHQGVDTDIFKPGLRRLQGDKRFYVYSGGKLEYRKGQDLLVRGFAKFNARYPESVLVSSWASPFPEAAASMAAGLLGQPDADIDGTPNLREWARRGGIARHVPLAGIANCALPRRLSRMDCAVFASRAEGGTDLCAMETIAMGIPTILSANTGHLDLLSRGFGTPLLQQHHHGDPRRRGWADSEPDEIADALERIYLDRKQANHAADIQAREFAAQFGWPARIEHLCRIIEERVTT